MPEQHPVQQDRFTHISSEVTALAYEVYCHVYGAQPALMDLAGRNCRGGFSTGELIAFLYARNFPNLPIRLTPKDTTPRVRSKGCSDDHRVDYSAVTQGKNRFRLGSNGIAFAGRDIGRSTRA